MRELSLHILDILQNSIEAGATQVDLIIEENLGADHLSITVRDNGRGMDEAMLARVADPFFTGRKTRRVGLGIPLLQAAAERCAGGVIIESEVGQGTTLKADFQLSHIDRAPLGDIAGTLMAVVLGGTCELYYLHRVVGKSLTGGLVEQEGEEAKISEFGFSTAELKAELGDVPLAHPAVREWLRAFIAEGEATLPPT